MKIRTRRRFHCGGSPAGRRPKGGSLGALVLADPVDEPAGLGVRQVPGCLGDRLHSIEKLLLVRPEGRFGVARGVRLGRGRQGLDLPTLLRFALLGCPLPAFVVGIRGRQEERGVTLADLRRPGAFRSILPARLLPLALDRRPVHLEAARKRLNRRQQPLLKPDDEQAGSRPRLVRGVLVPALPGGAVLVEQGGEHQLGGVVGQVLDDHGPHVAFRKAASNLADVLLQAAHHHVVQSTLAPHLDAAGEPVRVQKLQQGREAVRVAVVRRRGQEQAVLEAPGQVADCASELGFDPVAPAARGGGVVGLVEDQQAPGQHRPQPLAQRVRVARVDQEVVGDQKAAVGTPRVDPEAALPAHSREIRPVENLEYEPEAVLQLAFPLLQYRGRRRDDDGVRLPAQEQLAGDEARLDGLAEPGVVGNEKVDARQPERFAQRLHLVGVDADAGPERRLEQARVGRGDAVPAQRMQEGRELPRRVESLGGEIGPTFVLENQPVELVVPEDGQGLSLRIVVGAGEPDQGRLACGLRRNDFLDQPPPGAHLDQFAGGGCPFRKLLRQCSVHAPVIITPRSRTSPRGRVASRRGTRASSRYA